MKILVVDDTQDIAILVRKILAQEGYDVIEAENGEVAIGVLSTTKVDLVLLDINMKKMDGFDTMREIACLDESMIPKVCFLSARREKRDIMKALSLGADDYLIKPIDPLLLVGKVKSLLQSEKGEAEFSRISANMPVYLDQNFKLVELSEVGLRIVAGFELDLNSTVTLVCPELTTITRVEKFDVRVVSSERVEDEYAMDVEFVGFDEKARSLIRKHSIRGQLVEK